jgi:uncharacterized protein YraI
MLAVSCLAALLALSALPGAALPVGQTFGTGWTVSYYNTPDLTGSVVLTQALPAGLNFFFSGSPAPGVNANNWSARYTSVQQFAAGTYQFLVASDDGVRVFIDNQLVWDRFVGRTLTTDTFSANLAAGGRTLTVEYFNGLDNGALQFQWTQVFNVTVTPPTTAPTVFTTFTPFATATSLPCPTPGALVRGQPVVLRGGVNVRAAPSPSSAVVNYYPNEVLLTLIDGPVCADGYQWWRVTGVGEGGWVAEGRAGLVFLAPGAPIIDPNNICSPPLPMTLGGTALVLNNLRLRGTPSQFGRTLFVLPAFTEVTVLEGARCVANLNWWRVRVDGLEGWVAEGFPGNYWLSSQQVNFTSVQPSQCGRALELTVGSRVVVRSDANNLRSLRAAPTILGEVVASLLDGIALDVLDAPVCAEQMWWWRVRVVTTNVEGWIAQGRPTDPILSPLIR